MGTRKHQLHPPTKLNNKRRPTSPWLGVEASLELVVAEALALAEGAGLDRDTVIEVLMGTTAGRGHLGATYPAKVLAGDLEPGFMVDLALKDLGLALQMSADNGSSSAMGAAALPFYETAHHQGLGRRDWTAIYNLVTGRD